MSRHYPRFLSSSPRKRPVLLLLLFLPLCANWKTTTNYRCRLLRCERFLVVVEDDRDDDVATNEALDGTLYRARESLSSFVIPTTTFAKSPSSFF